MMGGVSSDVALPSEARGIVWRIFGAGESLLTNLSTYELIEPIVSRHLAPENRHQAIDEIRRWFDVDEDRQQIYSDIVEKIAVIIVEGIDSDRSDLAPWSIAWVSSKISGKIISSRWCDVRIKSFVDTVLRALGRLCNQDRILDPVRSARLADVEVNSTLPRGSFDRDGKVQTFDELYAHNSKLVHFGIHEKARNLMELIIDLEPDCFESMIERLDHRVVQAWAADYVSPMGELPGDKNPLNWISGSSCDDLIALAIVHTLNMVSRLDGSRHYAERVGEGCHRWHAEFRQRSDEIDRPATALLDGLADRLGALDSLDCARWVGELLSRAPNMLGRGVDEERPHTVGQLEEACTAVLARVAMRSWSEDLLEALISGLRLNTRETWTRHIVDVALAVRDSDRALASEMFRAALEQGERQVAEESVKRHFYINWSDWHYREWTDGLGVALAFAHEDIDLVKWVSDRCRPMPLSVWDVEADGASFYSADPVARFWFLVALHAIVHRGDAELVVEPTEVRALAELLWSHCHFVGQYLNDDVENSVAAEYAARCAIEYGDPSDVWLFGQVGSREVGPRALWALIHQRAHKRARERPTARDSEVKVTEKILRVASVRFGDGSRFGLEDLKYWSELWLVLEAVEEAERTAKAMLTILPRDREFRRIRGRSYEVNVLKLLSLVASTTKLSSAMESVVTRLYKDLWADSYIPEHERTDRQQIDEWLSRSAL